VIEELAGVELGGTKTIVVRGRPGAIRDRVEFPTLSPDSTLRHAADIIEAWHAERAIVRSASTSAHRTIARF
jgi:fructokinase